MQKLNIYDKNKGISDKGQKIVAALYLVTNHLSDTEPFKHAMRALALELNTMHSDRILVIETLTNHLKSAAIAKVVSDHNTSIIVRELAHFDQLVSDTLSLTSFFTPTQTSLSKTNNMSFKSLNPPSLDSTFSRKPLKNENKNKRQYDILSFINGRKSAAIKDISALFPEVSEKTIQRELGTLVDDGKITKRGSKRWSIYMAI